MYRSAFAQRLLQFEPGLPDVAPRRGRVAAQTFELLESTDFLDQVESGEAEAYLVDLIDRAAQAAVRHRLPRSSVTVALARLGGALASRVLRAAPPVRTLAYSRLFGLELEGLSAEDQQFAVARQFLRMVRAAAGHAAASPTVANAGQVALISLRRAAARHAPGLLLSLTTRSTSPPAPAPRRLPTRAPEDRRHASGAAKPPRSLDEAFRTTTGA